jgi:hypothetical protein
MRDKTPELRLRDDARDQPESGYPEGRISTKPSAAQNEDKRESQKGSEAEFDSEKVLGRG